MKVAGDYCFRTVRLFGAIVLAMGSARCLAQSRWSDMKRVFREPSVVVQNRRQNQMDLHLPRPDWIQGISDWRPAFLARRQDTKSLLPWLRDGNVVRCVSWAVSRLKGCKILLHPDSIERDLYYQLVSIFVHADFWCPFAWVALFRGCPKSGIFLSSDDIDSSRVQYGIVSNK